MLRGRRGVWHVERRGGRPAVGAAGRGRGHLARHGHAAAGPYCWSSRNADGTGQAVCADGDPPSCASAPHLAASPGETAKVRLAFEPTAAEMRLGSGQPASVAAGRDLAIPLGSFTGVAALTVHRGGDDVIYGVCVVRG